jgi:hypothetical protein
VRVWGEGHEKGIVFLMLLLLLCCDMGSIHRYVKDNLRNGMCQCTISDTISEQLVHVAVQFPFFLTFKV